MAMVSKQQRAGGTAIFALNRQKRLTATSYIFDSQFGDFGGFGGAGGGGFGGRFGRGFGGGFMGDFDQRIGAPAHAYQEYYRAYSMAMLPGKERPNVSYGGKSEYMNMVWSEKGLICERFSSTNAAPLIASFHQSSCLRQPSRD